MASAVDSTPIGASVIDYIQRNTASTNVNDPQQHQAAAAALDLDQSLVEDSTTTTTPSMIPCTESCNILLKGPRQSQQSSLVMNMAHAIASRPSSKESCCHGRGASSCSSCTAVAILKPLLVDHPQQTNFQQEQELFPLLCDFVESSQQPALDFIHQLRALQQQEQIPSKNKKPPTWNKTALRRIQVHRMTSIRHVMEFLLSPMTITGGIIVQDLDVFVRGNSNSDLTTEQLMTMTQILALLADTANTIRRRRCSSSISFSVMVTMADDTSVPSNVRSLWSTWFPTCLKIASPSPVVVWKSPPLQQEDERVESQFVLLQQQQQGNGTNNKEQQQQPTEVIAHYVIVRQNNGSLRIVWKKSNE